MADVRTIICGSPQPAGKCHALAGRLRAALRLRFPESEVRLHCVAGMRFAPCIGCNRCADGAGCCCAFGGDDAGALLRELGECSELYVVAPVYFAGPPSQLKALLDRFQPLYFAGARKAPKHPAHLVVLGGGGDPHGFQPLEAICRSALAPAGFALEDTLSCVGLELPEAQARCESWLDKTMRNEVCSE